MLFADSEFQSQPVGDALATPSDQFSGPEQYLLALVAAERRFVGCGDLEGPSRMTAIAGWNGADQIVGVR